MGIALRMYHVGPALVPQHAHVLVEDVGIGVSGRHTVRTVGLLFAPLQYRSQRMVVLVVFYAFAVFVIYIQKRDASVRVDIPSGGFPKASVAPGSLEFLQNVYVTKPPVFVLFYGVFKAGNVADVIVQESFLSVIGVGVFVFGIGGVQTGRGAPFGRLESHAQVFVKCQKTTHPLYVLQRGPHTSARVFTCLSGVLTCLSGLFACLFRVLTCLSCARERCGACSDRQVAACAQGNGSAQTARSN